MDDFRDNAGCFINLNVGTIFHKKYKIILTLIGGSHILGIFRIIEQLQYIDRGDGSDRGEPALMQRHLLCIMIYPVINQQRRSEEHTSELQSRGHLVCRLLLEKKNE